MTATRRGALLTILAAFGWLAATAWIRPLMLPDEGRYVGVAWEMMRSGRWAVPTLDGMPFFHKPPLFYWVGAAAMELFGPSAWAARFPSMLGATLAIGSLALFTRRWGDAAHARGTAVVLATAPFFCLGGQFANLDMLVAGCISATVVLGAHAVLLKAEGLPNRWPLWGAYLMAAVGMLAKGLIGFVLPGGVFIAWLLVTRRPRLILSLLSLPGLLIFLAVGLPWFLEMQHRYPGFYDYFVIYHHFKRFAQSGFNNQQPLWFYVPVVLALMLPWSLAIAGAFRLREQASRRPSQVALMWAWLAVVLVFFSLPKSKLIGYVLPALPPLAWLLAGALAPGAAKASRLSRHAGTLAVISALLSLVAVIGVAIARVHSASELGLALRAERQPGEPVLAVGRYPYDLPFYARLEQPMQVLGDWKDPSIPQHDDWRKELYDASLFDPVAGARQLVGQEAVEAVLCSKGRGWVVGGPELPREQAAWVPSLQEVARTKELVLWKFSCAGKPSAGSPGK